MLSHVQLRHTAFKEITLVAVEEGTLEGEVAVKHDLAVGLLNETDRLWHVAMTLEIMSAPGVPFAYEGRLRVQGILQIEPDYPGDQISAIYLHGAVLLYGVLREMVHNLTSRSIQGPLMLPTLNFQQILKETSGVHIARAPRVKRRIPSKQR